MVIFGKVLVCRTVKTGVVYCVGLQKSLKPTLIAYIQAKQFKNDNCETSWTSHVCSNMRAWVPGSVVDTTYEYPNIGVLIRDALPHCSRLDASECNYDSRLKGTFTM